MVYRNLIFKFFIVTFPTMEAVQKALADTRAKIEAFAERNGAWFVYPFPIHSQTPPRTLPGRPCLTSSLRSFFLSPSAIPASPYYPPRNQRPALHRYPHATRLLPCLAFLPRRLRPVFTLLHTLRHHTCEPITFSNCLTSHRSPCQEGRRPGRHRPRHRPGGHGRRRYPPHLRLRWHEVRLQRGRLWSARLQGTHTHEKGPGKGKGKGRGRGTRGTRLFVTLLVGAWVAVAVVVW